MRQRCRQERLSNSVEALCTETLRVVELDGDRAKSVHRAQGVTGLALLCYVVPKIPAPRGVAEIVWQQARHRKRRVSDGAQYAEGCKMAYIVAKL